MNVFYRDIHERHALHHSTERLLIEAIEAAGVRLIAADEAGAGVRLARPR